MRGANPVLQHLLRNLGLHTMYGVPGDHAVSVSAVDVFGALQLLFLLLTERIGTP